VKLGFVGLGVMGFPIAGHLQQAGHDVTVYNRTPVKANTWVAQYGGQSAATPRGAAEAADIVCMCVGNDDDVRAVALGDEGVIAGLAAGALVVDHTTASAELARDLGAAASERQLGPTGSGQLAKMVNQICIAGVVQGLAEALEFSEQAGLDSAAVIEVISRGAAQSWQMENRYRTMLAGEYEHGFAVDWMRKDLGMVLAEAQQLGLELPVTRLVDGYYAEVQEMGGRRWDTSSLFARMRAISEKK
jgi:3-hydroxyisobutyrate dehydrogenase-like beta-hydroxyacid dehydrogenase